MTNQNLNNEQKKTRNILYGILAFTIFLSVFIDFYHLIDSKHRPFINYFMHKIVNKRSMLGVNQVIKINKYT